MLGKFQFLPLLLMGSFLKAGDFFMKGDFIWYFPTLCKIARPKRKKPLKNIKKTSRTCWCFQRFYVILYDFLENLFVFTLRQRIQKRIEVFLSLDSLYVLGINYDASNDKKAFYRCLFPGL